MLDLKVKLEELTIQKNGIDRLLENIVIAIEDNISSMKDDSLFKIIFNRKKWKTTKTIKLLQRDVVEYIDKRKKITSAIEDLQGAMSAQIKQTVYIMVGIVGSGKSTWVEDKMGTTNTMQHMKIVNVCHDQIRTMIYNEYRFNPNNEDLVRNIAWDCMKRGVEKGCDVIIDETNITRKKRKQWVDYIRLMFGNQVKIVFVVCTERERNLRFRMTNPRGISKGTWERVIAEMKRDFETVGNEGQNETITHDIKKIELV